ncbi:hypothetical protein MtrunA17_Chr7g0260351 [Medicago truncatula]|uniref:Uncharacterized protein n=1 Tax=Medicago truncatula TaxID=3880 RepID=A0A396H6H9_MEDTR|nr:hypothetical protein MtrunA17_Chr7g0260351 [Medicago truncatula]
MKFVDGASLFPFLFHDHKTKVQTIVKFKREEKNIKPTRLTTNRIFTQKANSVMILDHQLLRTILHLLNHLHLLS